MSIAGEIRRVAKQLRLRNEKVVFAESCTGGLAAGALTRVPGISDHLCGGMVVYRNETKIAYLGIEARILDHPGPVSRQVTQQMAEEILRRTPEAHWGAAVTGHLGPQAPKSLDGVVFCCVARRSPSGGPVAVASKRFKYPAATSRRVRQRQATEDLLRLLGDTLSRHM